MTNFILQTQIKDLDLCDALIELHKTSKHKTPGCIGNDQGQHVVDKTVKDSVDCVLDKASPEFSRYLNELQISANLYMTDYPYSSAYTNWGLIEPINIQYYPPGGGYKDWHTERSRGTGIVGTRHLAFMTYLNDVTDLGQTVFFHQNLEFSPKKGITLIWPADWTHTHKGVVSPTQEKYIVTGWFNFAQ